MADTPENETPQEGNTANDAVETSSQDGAEAGVVKSTSAAGKTPAAKKTSAARKTAATKKATGARKATAAATTPAAASASGPETATGSSTDTPDATSTTESTTTAGSSADGADTTPDGTSTAPAAAEQPAQEKKGTPSWWLPAATFVVGLLLGAGVLYAMGSGSSGETAAAASPTPSASPSATTGSDVPADRTVTVPGECLALADDSQQVLDLVDQAVTRARDLDASGLSDVVRQLQTSRDSLEQNTQACRSSVEISPSP